ncbi:MAG: hypothetical protein QM784_01970 [Polyangiaceae bacterium]
MNRWRHCYCAGILGRVSRHLTEDWARRTVTPLFCCTALLASGCAKGTDVDESVAVGTSAIESATSPTTLAMTDEAKQTVILDVLEKFVPFAESFWRASDIAEARTGRYDAIGSGVTQPRGAGDIAFAYVTLLEARPNQATYGGVSREVMIDHTIQSNPPRSVHQRTIG